MNPTVLDLFAGVGGLSHGLEAAGFDVKWANEIDPQASTTFSASHKAKLWSEDANVFLKRIVEKDDEVPQSGEVDILVGGPPCQGFSGYNRYRSPDDPRNSLVELFLAFVEVLLPRYILIENVPGMLQMENGKVPHLLISVLEKLNYNAHLGILQAGHYGVPQNRWRVFLIAAKRELPLPGFPEPDHSFPKTTLFGATKFRHCVIRTTDKGSNLFRCLEPNTTVSSAIRDLPEISNGQKTENLDYKTLPLNSYQRALRADSFKVKNHSCKNLGELMMARVRAVPKRPGAGWLDLPEELKPKNLAKHGDNRYNNRFGRLWWDGIFNTIVSEANPYWGRVIHPEQERVISVREAARAQSLPDYMEFFGSLAEQYKQVGNAVPPNFGKAIGIEIRRSMGINLNQ
jgi:DNA (cytosine-5)-methyltransferase 1